MNQQERAKELAAAHWGYVKPTMEVHAMLNREGTDLNEPVYSWNEMMEIAAYHYRTAMEHGYGHGVEDQRNGMYDTEGAAAAIADVKRDMAEWTMVPNTCADCARNDCAEGQYPITPDGGCEGYISALRENMLGAKQEATPPMCDTCTKERVCGFKHGSVSQCELYERFEGYDKAEQEAIAAGQVGANCTTEVCRHYSPMFMRNCPQYSSSAISGCAYYRPEWEETKQEAPTAAVLPSTHTDPSTNCKDCHNAACVGKGRDLTCDQGCERFTPKELAHDAV